MFVSCQWDSMTSEQCNSLSAADAVCAAAPRRPRVAVCIAGHARTLTQAVVWRTMLTNLLEAFGGEQTRFAFVQVKDAVGNPTSKHPLNKADDEAVRDVLGKLGVVPSRMYVEHERIVPYPPCPEYNVSERNGLIRDWTESGRRTWGTSHEYFESLLGQLESRARCYSTLVAFEARQGHCFDQLIYTRTDLTWPMAVRPHCLWSACVRKDDWVWLGVRRDDVERTLMQSYRDLHSCRRIFQSVQNGDSVNSFIFAGFDPCRHDPERLSALVTRNADPEQRQSAMLPCAAPSTGADRLFSSREQCHSATFLNPCANARLAASRRTADAANGSSSSSWELRFALPVSGTHPKSKISARAWAHWPPPPPRPGHPPLEHIDIQ